MAVLLSGCSKKDDIPEKVYLSGKWTQVNEQSMTSGYIEFQEGKMARYISSIGDVVAMEDALWHCSSSDFTEESVCSYYIQDKCLYVDGKPSGRMEDDELYIDDKLYCSFNDFEEDYYVTIVTDVTDNVIILPFCAAEQEFSVSLTRYLPHSSLSVSTSDEWIKSLGLDEGNVSFVTEAPVEDREGSIRISYPGAADQVVSVTQKCERFIRPAVTEMSFDCISREVSLSYMIENPVEGEVLTVTTDAEWISEIRVEKDRVVVLLASNEDGTAREAVLLLSYKEANPVEVKVSQSFPSLTLSQESQETDYSSKTLSFTYSVNNAAEGQVLEAVSGVAWISGIAVDGNTVTYIVSENNSGSSRSGEITLTYAGVVRTFTVTQSYSASVLRLTQSEGSSDYAGGTYEFGYSITNEREGESVRATSSSDWITAISVSVGKISYKVGLNATGKSRSGEIVVKYSTATATYKVTQSAAEFILSESSASHGYASASGTIGYNIANRHDSEQLKLSTTASWITGLTDSNGSVRYNVSENNSGSSRSGEITLTYAGVVRTFTVTQSYTASGLKLTQSEGSSDYAGGTYEFGCSVTNEREGESVRATSSSDWITAISVSVGKISYKVGLNATGKSRSGEIVVKYSTATATYKVTQSAAGFTLSESSASHGYASASGTIGYNIANRLDSEQLKLSTTASWITGLTDSNGSVRYNVSENNSGSSRSGEITLTYAGVVRTFTVTQSYSASTITLSSGSQTTDYTSKKLNFTVNITNPRENLSLSGKATAEWIQDLTINGNMVSYTVDKNISVNQREATITINYENDTKKFKTIQTGHPVTELTLNKTSVTLLAGESETLAASAFPLDTKVQWSSSSPAIASVDQNGKVTGIDNGTTIITVASADGIKTATCEVTVIVPVTGVSLDRTSAEIIKGDSMTLTATVAPSNATNKNVIWTSSDPSVATVSQSGVITAIKAGSTTVVATTIDGEKAAACEIVVIVPVNSISLDKESLELIEGDGASLTATIGPDDATDKRIIWKSSDDSIAIVSSSGAVVAVKAGTVTITATTNDGGFTAECNLTVIKRVVSGGIEDTEDDNWGM